MTSTPSRDADRLRSLEERFRGDIALQLEQLGYAVLPSSVDSHVSISPDAVVLEISPDTGGTAFRAVARLEDERAAREGWARWLTVSLEDAETRHDVLTLAWLDEGEILELLERRVDESLPLEQRGLNAAADIREGRYARGDALRHLKAELQAATRGNGFERSAVGTTLPARLSPVPAPAILKASNTPDAPAPPVRPPALPAIGRDKIPPELLEIIGGFQDFLHMQAAGTGLRRGEVVAFLQEGLRERYAERESHLEARSVLTAIPAALEPFTLMAGLAVAYGAEAMASGFAFEDMIGANWLNWPLGFASAFLFGGGLMVLTKGKEKQFWNAVAALWVMSVAVVATRNDTLVDPAQVKIGIERPDVLEKWNRRTSKKTELADLERQLAKKDADLARDKDRAGVSAKFRSTAVTLSGDAVRKTEARREAAFQAANDAEKAWNLAKRSDSSRWKAGLLVFVWTMVLNGAGAWYIAKYISTRRDAHEKALDDARTRRRTEHDLKALRDSRKAQEAWGCKLAALMRAAYAMSLERSARFSAADVTSMTNAAFGGNDEETASIVKQAVQGFRDALRPARRNWLGLWGPRAE